MTLSFPKTLRLKSSSEFFRVKKEGRSYSGRYMTLGVLAGAGEAKIGLITSRRVGGAVVRNRVRRRLREIARLNRPQWGTSRAWIVVVARAAAAGAPFEVLRGEWERLARRAGLLKGERPANPRECA